jgi:hypothetical protein
MFEAVKEWFFSLGPRYGVNPLIFGSIYVGAIPFFAASIAWLINNLRNRKPIAVPFLSASFFFVSAYLYLLVVGRNIPAWVYAFLAFMLMFGLYSTVQKVRKSTEQGR